MRRFALVLAVVLALSGFAAADVYIKSNVHTDAMSVMGQNTPANDAVTEQWLGDGVFAMNSESISTIVDLKKNVGLLILHGSKSYVEYPLPLDLAKLLPPEAAQFASMMKMTATVAPNGQTKTIGKWKCAGYDVTLGMAMGMTMKIAMWASTDVPFDAAKYMKDVYRNMQVQMMDPASLAEFAKIQGFPIASDMSGEMMGATMHTTTQVAEIAQKAAPAGTYEVPKGYAKKTQLSMADFQGMGR